MNTTPQSIGIAIDTWSTLSAGLYPPGFNPTSGITASMHRLGTRISTRDGRGFRFARIGGVAAVAGSLYQASAPVAGNLAQTPAAAAIGATQVVISTITTTVTANQYSEGWLQVDTTPGNGIMYGIDGHNAATGGSGACNVNLYADEAIQVALTTSSRVGLIANPYADIIVAPTTLTAVAVGVPLVAAAIGAYCWIQTWGPCPVLINGTPAVTAPVINSATTAGAVDVWTAAAQPTAQMVGHMMQVGVSTKNNAVFLTLG